MRNFGLLLCLILGLVLGGCSLFQKTTEAKKFYAERIWVRSTLKDPSLGHSFAHQMVPYFAEGIIYAGNSQDGLVAYDLETGSQRWRVSVKGGVNSGVELDGDLLYFGGSDGQFYSVDARTGRMVWSFPTRVENLAPPLVRDGFVYFLSGNNFVYALDAKTGKQKWVYDRGANQEISVRGGTKPGWYNGTLYFGFTDGFLVALNSKDGSVSWERQLNTNVKFKDVDSSPVVTDQQIFVAGYDNSLYCLSRSDGQVVWKQDKGASASVSLQDDKLFVATSSGTIEALKKSNGEVIWSRTVKGGVATQAIYLRGVVVYGESDGPLHFADAQTGQDTAVYEPGWGTLAAPAVDLKKGNVYLMSTAGNIHALKTGWKAAVDLMPPVGVSR